MAEYQLSYTGAEIDKAIGDVINNNITAMSSSITTMQSDIEKLEAKVEDTGWIDLELLNGAEGLSDFVPQYRKIGNIVFLSGIIKLNSADSIIAASFPVGFNPHKAIEYVFPVSEASSGLTVVRRARISGNITFTKASTESPSSMYNISCSFVTAQ